MDSVKLCSMIRSDAALKHVSIIMANDSTAASLVLREAGANTFYPEAGERSCMFR
jgi:hypothetical protein